MGGTIILWEALRTDQIGFYPEYTGTIDEEILKASPSISAAEMRAQLEKFGVGITGELGFNNTYALVMQASGRAAITNSPDQRSAKPPRA